ncbi:NUDIX domain-containing protein [Amycolatopsis sp. NPDC059090]|uniref:NUDIX domain-containing protein n=1 Tax=unclassified Amycolatopsis TaxID=2618356 RepID=UPI00366E3C34
MNNNTRYTPGPRVGAYALIGRGEDILFITDDTGAFVLPGGTVRDGEPVEHALRRTVRDQIEATITGLRFCSVVEHRTVDGRPWSSSELAFLFDVTLADTDSIAARRPHTLRWAGEAEVALLRPAAIADGLAAGDLYADVPWRAWTP